jgi:Domain of unknown function (DUF1918)
MLGRAHGPDTMREFALAFFPRARASLKREGETQVKPQAGDRIVVESEKLAIRSRAGVIEEVLQEDPARVRVRWEDGHTSILTPSGGAARVTRAKA